MEELTVEKLTEKFTGTERYLRPFVFATIPTLSTVSLVI